MRMYVSDGKVELYSHPATRQDRWVIERLSSYRNGYFVEIGGYDGRHHSNTLALEEHFNWRGLLVEADPDLYEQAKLARPNCAHDCAAVSVTDGCDVQFSRGGVWGGLVAFLPDAWRYEATYRHTPEIWVPTTTLSNVLKRNYAPKLIDYFSLDVEGAELPILNEYFLKPTHHFRCLTVEFRDNITLMRLMRLLEPHGYVLERVCAWDAFFTFNLARSLQ